MSHIADELGFECYQMDSGVWIKERPDGRRGLCVADEAVLWQALQAALAGGKPQQTVDVADLVRENELLAKENERLARDVEHLVEENALLRANQRQKPGRKPRPRSDAGPAGDPEALAAPEQEQDLLDEDL